MDFITDYGMFLAKAVTIVISIGIVVGLISSAGQRNRKGDKKGSIKVSRINEHIDELRDALRDSVLDKDQLKAIEKVEKKKAKDQEKKKKKLIGEEDTKVKRYFVLNFEGNIAADAVASLREEITALLSMATDSDEVIL